MNKSMKRVFKRLELLLELKTAFNGKYFIKFIIVVSYSSFII